MRSSREEGVVLLLVLVTLVLTISTVYAFTQTSVLGLMAQKQRLNRVRAELLARSGLAIGLRALADDASVSYDDLTQAFETPLDPWAVLSERTLEVPDGGTLEVAVRDSGHKVNLNGLLDGAGEPHAESRSFLAAALEHVIEYMPGRAEDKQYLVPDLADAILDWLDGNQQTRLGDDESSFYAEQGAAGVPPDRPLFALEELAGVPGLDAALLAELRAYFTTYPLFPGPGQAGVNPNTAPSHVLALVYRGTAGDLRLLDEADVFAILRARRQGRIFCPDSTREPCVSFASEIGRVGESVFPPLRYQSDTFEILSRAQFDEARACITAVIDRKELAELSVLSYRMDCA